MCNWQNEDFPHLSCFFYLSKKMVAMWTCGDCFKTGYFIVRHAPAQFWICGMLQVGIDISIFLQVYCYRNKAAISWPTPHPRILI